MRTTVIHTGKRETACVRSYIYERFFVCVVRAYVSDIRGKIDDIFLPISDLPRMYIAKVQ